MENIKHLTAALLVVLTLAACNGFEEPEMTTFESAPGLSMEFNGQVIELDVVDGAYYNETFIDTFSQEILFLQSDLSETGCNSLCTNSLLIMLAVDRDSLDFARMDPNNYFVGDYSDFELNAGDLDSIEYTFSASTPLTSNSTEIEWNLTALNNLDQLQGSERDFSWVGSIDEEYELSVTAFDQFDQKSCFTRNFTYHELREKDNAYISYEYEHPVGLYAQVHHGEPGSLFTATVKSTVYEADTGDSILFIPLIEKATVEVSYMSPFTSELILDVIHFDTTGQIDIPAIQVENMTRRIPSLSNGGQSGILGIEVYWIDQDGELWSLSPNQPSSSVFSIRSAQSFIENQYSQATALLDIEFDLVFQDLFGGQEEVRVQNGRATMAFPVSE